MHYKYTHPPSLFRVQLNKIYIDKEENSLIRVFIYKLK